jgi:hypothetical protein
MKQIKHKHILMSVVMAALVLVSLFAVSASALSVSAAQSSSYVNAPAVVGAPVGSGAPAACSPDGKGLDLFIRGADNHLYLKTSTDGTSWTGPSYYLGGGLTSGPGATVRDTINGLVTVFVRGDDGAIYYRDGKGIAFGPWTSIGGKTAANKAPAVCSWNSDGRIDVFVAGADGLLWHKSYTNTAGWADHWDSLGGKLTSGPAATATTDGSHDIGVFVVGVNSAVFFKQYTPSGWGSWILAGGKVLAGTSPAAYNWGTDHLGWLVTGTDYQLYHNWVGKSNGYEVIAASLTSSPAATAKANGIIDAFGRGSTGQFAALYQNSYNYGGSSVWSGWTAIGGV